MGSAGGDWKALYEAAKNGNLDEVRDWLEAGVDPNLQHVEMGTTALIVAAERGHLDVVKALVEGGADPAIRSHWENQTALEAARELGKTGVADWLAALSRS